MVKMWKIMLPTCWVSLIFSLNAVLIRVTVLWVLTACTFRRHFSWKTFLTLSFDWDHFWLFLGSFLVYQHLSGLVFRFLCIVSSLEAWFYLGNTIYLKALPRKDRIKLSFREDQFFFVFFFHDIFWQVTFLFWLRAEILF